MLKYNGNNIKKVYKNKDIVKKIYKNSNVVFEYQNTLLPQGYQECKYIQTTGTEYIKLQDPCFINQTGQEQQ